MIRSRPAVVRNDSSDSNTSLTTTTRSSLSTISVVAAGSSSRSSSSSGGGPPGRTADTNGSVTTTTTRSRSSGRYYVTAAAARNSSSNNDNNNNNNNIKSIVPLRKSRLRRTSKQQQPSQQQQQQRQQHEDPAQSSSTKQQQQQQQQRSMSYYNRTPRRRQQQRSGIIAILGVFVIGVFFTVIVLMMMILLIHQQPQPSSSRHSTNNNDDVDKNNNTISRRIPPPFGPWSSFTLTTSSKKNNDNDNEKNNNDIKNRNVNHDDDEDNTNTDDDSTTTTTMLDDVLSILSKESLDMCTRTLWHTIETTTIVMPNEETFIHTGDIDDLWLRDSAAQIHPLLISSSQKNNHHKNNKKNKNRIPALILSDSKLDRIVRGLIKRTMMYIKHDPYANAFRIDNTYKFNQQQKLLGRHDLISTWNYELDSACYTFRMIYFYWKAYSTTRSTTTSSTSSSNSENQGEKEEEEEQQQQKKLPDVLFLSSIRDSMNIMIDLWTAEQKHEDDIYPTGSLFDDCSNCNKPYRYPGLLRSGKGRKTNSSSGLTWSGFRPSDDECYYNFLIPANMFAVTVLEYIHEMATVLYNDQQLANKAIQLAKSIQQGIETHAIIQHDIFGTIYAYEVDGLGNYILMDDSNVPSLMSIPYINYKHYDPQIYANTRRFILSRHNPTYRIGTKPIITDTWTKKIHQQQQQLQKNNKNIQNNEEDGQQQQRNARIRRADTGSEISTTETETKMSVIEGYGSPHMGNRISNNIWPMSLAIQGLTSNDVLERIRIIETLSQITGNTGWMHESIDINNPKHYTRSWFCWSDSLYAELVLTTIHQYSSSSSSSNSHHNKNNNNGNNEDNRLTCPNPKHKYKVFEWNDPIQIKGGKYAYDGNDG